MKKILFLLVFGTITKSLFSQYTFLKASYDVNYLWSDQQFVKTINTLDEGLMAMGGDTTMPLTKLDSAGNVVWSKKYYSLVPYYSHWADIIQLGDSGYVMLCNMNMPGATKFGLIKVNKNGIIEWAKYNFSAGSNPALCMCKTEEGFIIAGGGCSGENYVINFDSNGNIIWQNQYINIGTYGWGTSIIQSSSGDFILTSQIRIGLSLDFYLGLIRIDVNGNLKWFKRFGGNDWWNGLHLTEIADGSIIVCGYTGQYSNFNDAFIMRTDSAGNLLWCKIFQYGDYSSLNKIISCFPSEFSAIGYGAQNAFYSKMDFQGNIIWRKSIDNVGLNSIIKSYDNGFYISGQILLNNIYQNMIAKIDSNGIGLCQTDSDTVSIQNVYNQVADTVIIVFPMGFIMDTISFLSHNYISTSTIICSNTSSVSEELIDKDISLYPNPSSDFIFVNYKPKTPHAQFEIIDVMGRKIFSFKFPLSVSPKQIDISYLPQGLYLLKITDGDMYSVKRFVKK